MKAVYKDEEGNSVIVGINPAWEPSKAAQVSVPKGVPYKLFEDSSPVPTDFSNPDGYGDPEGYWAEHEGT